MAIKRNVETKFNASGNINKKFTLWEKAAARFGRSADKSFKRASRGASRFSSVTRGVLAASGITNVLSLIQRGIGAVTTGFIAFDKAALGATVRFKDIGPEASNFEEQLKKIRGAARDAGATTEFTAAQAAEALDFLARAGFSSAEAMGSLSAMIDLATASGEDFATVADMSSDLMGAFGLEADTTAKKVASLNRLNDVLVKTANSANVTIESMFETMKTAGPVGRIAGIGLEEVAAATAVLGNAGIKGTEAGTALKNAILNITAPTPKMLAMMDRIGLVTDDGTGNMKKFATIIGEVGEKINDMGNLDQAQVLNAIFGKRAIAGSKNLIDNIKTLKDFEKTLLSAGDTSRKTAEIMRTSIDAKLKTLNSTVTDLGFSIFEAFEVKGKSGIDALTESIRGFDIGLFIESMKIVLGIAKALFIPFQLLGTLIANIAIGIAKFDDLTGILSFVFDGLNQIGGVALALGKYLIGAGSLSELGGSLGIGGGDESAAPQAPNQAEANARAQQSTFSGRLDIGGAPANSTLSIDHNSSSAFDVALLGGA